MMLLSHSTGSWLRSWRLYRLRTNTVERSQMNNRSAEEPSRTVENLFERVEQVVEGASTQTTPESIQTGPTNTKVHRKEREDNLGDWNIPHACDAPAYDQHGGAICPDCHTTAVFPRGRSQVSGAPRFVSWLLIVFDMIWR